MASGLFTDRDFQLGKRQAWHGQTRIVEVITRDCFPQIQPQVIFHGGRELIVGDKRVMVPVSLDDNKPVAPPYCEGTYTFFPPQEGIDYVDSVLSGTGYDIDSAGMLWDRSFWFVGVRLTELSALTVGDGRQCLPYLNFSGGLDKSVSPQAELSTILPVCWNTISESRRSGEVLFHKKLTRNFRIALDAARAEIERACGMAAVFKASMDSLATRPCNQDRAERIFAGYLTPAGETEMSTRTRNTVSELRDLHVTGDGNRGETEFDALNAFTQLLTRGSSDPKSRVAPMKAFASGEFGGNADRKAAFARLLTVDEERETLPAIEQRGAQLLAAN